MYTLDRARNEINNYKHLLKTIPIDEDLKTIFDINIERQLMSIDYELEHLRDTINDLEKVKELYEYIRNEIK